MNDTKYPTPGIGGGQGRREIDLTDCLTGWGWSVVLMAVVLAVGAIFDWWNR